MDIKLRNYSHLLTTKIIVFILAVLCFTGVLKAMVDVEVLNDGYFGIVSEADNYYLSESYVRESEQVLADLTNLIVEFKNEEHILKGATISEEENKRLDENLFTDFRFNSSSYDPERSETENYETFKVEYAEKIAQARGELIEQDLKEFNLLLQRLEENKGILYYASDGETAYASSKQIEKEHFKTYPSYIFLENFKTEVYPKEIKENQRIYRITILTDKLGPENNVVYLAFTQEFLKLKAQEWQENKVITAKSLSKLLVFLFGFLIFFIYLLLVVGRKSFKDQEVYLNSVDRLYNDLNLGLCLLVIILWSELVAKGVYPQNFYWVLIPLTVPFAALGLILVLSLVKHLKNRTFLKHTLIYTAFYRVFKFVGDVYASGSLGVKTVLIVIGYPLVVAATFFMFPLTLGVAAWFAFKRIKAFKAIKEGVGRIKAGDIQHTIAVEGTGEFAGLATNINSITEGLKTAVDNELKSERLKTELITNVSHDIRTPLTSIITYVDLLKKEKDPLKVEEYIEVLDQKSKRLKLLTDDLFEAAKASSGNIPVNLERIDILSLVTQGLGEVSAKIEALGLDFKLHHPKDKLYVIADGKLLWRSIENLLSNIFKYALRDSRVYVDIQDLGTEILLTFKNISAYELNISVEELMERFKRGDESRSSQGSGLGLSIAKSLIDIQKGKFVIQVDGDLFKAMIYMPKDKSNN